LQCLKKVLIFDFHCIYQTQTVMKLLAIISAVQFLAWTDKEKEENKGKVQLFEGQPVRGEFEKEKFVNLTDEQGRGVKIVEGQWLVKDQYGNTRVETNEAVEAMYKAETAAGGLQVNPDALEGLKIKAKATPAEILFQCRCDHRPCASG
jgi:hypothetical protein